MKGRQGWLSIVGAAGMVAAWAADEPKVDLTVYNSNLGVIRERRTLTLPVGRGEVRFIDVAREIDPTSVHFKALADATVKVLDQNYEFDLVSADKLLTKYVDQELTVTTKDKGEVYEGTLLSFDGNQLVVKSAKGLALINRANVQDIRLATLPEGLITKPTLVWLMDGGKGGPQPVEIAYLTGGMQWRCDYTVVVDAKDAQFTDFGGWVTLQNHSGATYANARLKLMAGDVQRVTPPGRGWAAGKMAMEQAAQGGGGEGFAEKAFFEYHLYSLGRQVTIKDNQIKQEELLTSHEVPVKKLYEFDGARHQKVAVKLEFKNDKASKLGMPLPQGRVRIYKEDPDTKVLEFLGEDALDHTPKDEKRTLKVGDAFDLVGERKQTDQKQLGRGQRQTWELKLKNRKDQEAVAIRVLEHFWGEWDVTKESLEGKKKDAHTYEWEVPVKAGEEVTLTFTVEQRW